MAGKETGDGGEGEGGVLSADVVGGCLVLPDLWSGNGAANMCDFLLERGGYLAGCARLCSEVCSCIARSGPGLESSPSRLASDPSPNDVSADMLRLTPAGLGRGPLSSLPPTCRHGRPGVCRPKGVAVARGDGRLGISTWAASSSSHRARPSKISLFRRVLKADIDILVAVIHHHHRGRRRAAPMS
jgi:hypothetical protein